MAIIDTGTPFLPKKCTLAPVATAMIVRIPPGQLTYLKTLFAPIHCCSVGPA